MIADLLVRNATLPDGRAGVDVLVAGGRIVNVSQRIDATAAQTVDARGQLLAPPFVDAHFHMDATLSYGLPRVNRSGTLLEGIALWGELKPLLTQDAIVERALAYCDWAVAKGLLAIRSHVDVCDPRLLAVEALLHVKERVRPYLDLQLVAFPQDGVLRSPGALDLLKRALTMGVDVVGGIPHFERTMADGAESVRLLCELAAARGLRVDMHCDETDDPHSRHVDSRLPFEWKQPLHARVDEPRQARLDVAVRIYHRHHVVRLDALRQHQVVRPQELLEQPPLAGPLHRLDAQLELAPCFVQRHRGRHFHLVAIARRPVQQLVAAAEHHAAHLRLVVLEYEVPVSARRAGEVGDLAAHPHERKAAFQQSRNRAVQRGNRQGTPRRCLLRAAKVRCHAGFRAETVHKRRRGAEFRSGTPCREGIDS